MADIAIAIGIMLGLVALGEPLVIWPPDSWIGLCRWFAATISIIGLALAVSLPFEIGPVGLLAGIPLWISAAIIGLLASIVQELRRRQ